MDVGSDSSSDSSVEVSITVGAVSYDDYNYLEDDTKWFKHCHQPEIPEKSKEELQRLSSIQDHISSHTDTINRHYVRGLTKGKLSHFARVVIVATVIRHLILNSEAAQTGDVLPREEFINNPAYVFKAAPGKDELLRLPRFKRAMQLAYPLIDRCKKQFLLDVCSYLDGPYLKCITGSKAKDITKCRVKIFEEVSDTTPVKRAPRIRKKANDEGVEVVSNGKDKKRTLASGAEKGKKKSRKD